MVATELIRVLIVEDDEDDFVIARDLLVEQEHARFEVAWASSGPEAQRMIAEGDFDIFLIDHRLGAVTGLDLVRHSFGGEPRAPVVMLTGTADYEVDLEATMLGVTDFLTKDRLDGETLERSIRYAVRHHAVLAELRESQDRFELAVRGANDGIWDWDLATDQIYYGPRWKSILGHAEDGIGNSTDEWFSRVHPQDLERVQAAIKAHRDGLTPHLESEHRMRHAEGGYRWVFARGVAVRNPDGAATRIAGSMSDITDRKAAEEQLLHDARHDTLTGLPNRAMFLDHLELSLSRAKRNPEYRCAVLFLDLNRFKLINDAFSHAVGDQLLVALAGRLNSALRPGDTVARLGGDEFTILLHDIESTEAAVEVAQRIQAVLSEPFQTKGRDLIVTSSIGIAISEPGSLATELMGDADIAMYDAKRESDDDVAVFTVSMRRRVVGQLRLESELRTAIDQQQLRVFYQPIVEIANGQIVGFEALARWPEDAEREISPVEFIPIAEETGLIRPLGRLVMNEACGQLSRWRDRGLVEKNVTMSVNVSARQLSEPDLVADVIAAAQKSGLPTEALRLELTEGTIMRDPERLPAILSELEVLGVRAHIDDFGTGYSSFTFLRRFGGNTLKIDRSFIASMRTDDASAEIVRTIIELARNLDLDVIAEGVETEEELSVLAEVGGVYAQGFLFARPLDRVGVEELLASWDPPKPA